MSVLRGGMYNDVISDSGSQNEPSWSGHCEKSARTVGIKKYMSKSPACGKLGGGFKDFLFSSLFGEDFSDRLKPPTSKGYGCILSCGVAVTDSNGHDSS